MLDLSLVYALKEEACLGQALHFCRAMLRNKQMEKDKKISKPEKIFSPLTQLLAPSMACHDIT